MNKIIIFCIILSVNFISILAEAVTPEWELGLGQFSTWTLGGSGGTTFTVSTNISPNFRLFYPINDQLIGYVGSSYRRFTIYQQSTYWDNSDYWQIPLGVRYDFGDKNSYLTGGLNIDIKTNEYCSFNSTQSSCSNNAATDLFLVQAGYGHHLSEFWNGRLFFEVNLDYSINTLFPGTNAMDIYCGLNFRSGF